MHAIAGSVERPARNVPSRAVAFFIVKDLIVSGAETELLSAFFI